MEAREIVERISCGLAARTDCLSLALDRGRGEGMLIEKWLLVEMLARLTELKKEGQVSQVEGEHKYPAKKTSRYEHCDLWWAFGQQEHWIEVKTIVPPRDRQGWKKAILDDLDKRPRLRSMDLFHHLALAFPLTPLQIDPMLNDLNWLYSSKGFKSEASWKYSLGAGKTLLVALFQQVEPPKPNALDFFKPEKAGPGNWHD